MPTFSVMVRVTDPDDPVPPPLLPLPEAAAVSRKMTRLTTSTGRAILVEQVVQVHTVEGGQDADSLVAEIARGLRSMPEFVELGPESQVPHSSGEIFRAEVPESFALEGNVEPSVIFDRFKVSIDGQCREKSDLDVPRSSGLTGARVVVDRSRAALVRPKKAKLLEVPDSLRMTGTGGPPIDEIPSPKTSSAKLNPVGKPSYIQRSLPNGQKETELENFSGGFKASFAHYRQRHSASKVPESSTVTNINVSDNRKRSSVKQPPPSSSSSHHARLEASTNVMNGSKTPFLKHCLTDAAPKSSGVTDVNMKDNLKPSSVKHHPTYALHVPESLSQPKSSESRNVIGRPFSEHRQREPALDVPESSSVMNVDSIKMLTEIIDDFKPSSVKHAAPSKPVQAPESVSHLKGTDSSNVADGFQTSLSIHRQSDSSFKVPKPSREPKISVGDNLKTSSINHSSKPNLSEVFCLPDNDSVDGLKLLLIKDCQTDSRLENSESSRVPKNSMDDNLKASSINHPKNTLPTAQIALHLANDDAVDRFIMPLIEDCQRDSASEVPESSRVIKVDAIGNFKKSALPSSKGDDTRPKVPEASSLPNGDVTNRHCDVFSKYHQVAVRNTNTQQRNSAYCDRSLPKSNESKLNNVRNCNSAPPTSSNIHDHTKRHSSPKNYDSAISSDYSQSDDTQRYKKELDRKILEMMQEEASKSMPNHDKEQEDEVALTQLKERYKMELDCKILKMMTEEPNKSMPDHVLEQEDDLALRQLEQLENELSKLLPKVEDLSTKSKDTKGKQESDMKDINYSQTEQSNICSDVEPISGKHDLEQRDCDSLIRGLRNSDNSQQLIRKDSSPLTNSKSSIKLKGNIRQIKRKSAVSLILRRDKLMRFLKETSCRNQESLAAVYRHKIELRSSNASSTSCKLDGKIKTGKSAQKILRDYKLMRHLKSTKFSVNRGSLIKHPAARILQKYELMRRRRKCRNGGNRRADDLFNDTLNKLKHNELSQTCAWVTNRKLTIDASKKKPSPVDQILLKYKRLRLRKFQNWESSKGRRSSPEVAAEHRVALASLGKYFLQGECLICGFLPQENGSSCVSLHMKEHLHENGSVLQYKSNCCDRTFDSSLNLYMHAMKCSRTNYSCMTCCIQFRRFFHLKRHNEQFHRNCRL